MEHVGVLVWLCVIDSKCKRKEKDKMGQMIL